MKKVEKKIARRVIEPAIAIPPGRCITTWRPGESVSLHVDDRFLDFGGEMETREFSNFHRRFCLTSVDTYLYLFFLSKPHIVNLNMFDYVRHVTYSTWNH